MFWTIVIALLMVWALAVISGNLFGGAIHVALVVAGGLVLLRLFQRRRRPPTADTSEPPVPTLRPPRPSHPV